jgi:hypothetical protein
MIARLSRQIGIASLELIPTKVAEQDEFRVNRRVELALLYRKWPRGGKAHQPPR